MNSITIKPFDITTTQFGFGCSSLLGLLSERESARLIDCAYDAGIRHFDVARSYGYGAVEGLLGRTLGSRRANVTITTKFGLSAPKSQMLVRTARALARPLVKRLSGMRARSKSVLSAIAVTVDFNAQNAAQSLTESLKALRSSHIDLFLLHEVRTDLLTDPHLLDFLGDAVVRGKIKGYGAGSDLTALPGLIESHPEYCPVVQHEWSVYLRDISIPESSSRVCHGALLRSFDRLRATIAVNPKSISDAVGMDLSNPANVSALLLRGAFLQHPRSLTLFSARSTERIQKNLESLTNAHLDPHCARLVEVLQVE